MNTFLLIWAFGSIFSLLVCVRMTSIWLSQKIGKLMFVSALLATSWIGLALTLGDVFNEIMKK